MYSDSTLNDNSQLSWSYAPVPSGDNTGYVDIAYAPAPPPKPDKNSYGTFVAVGKGYENNGYVARACISTNVGTPWRHVLIEPSVYRFPHRIIYSPENNTFLALLNSSNGRYGHVYYSNDGNTWAHATLNNTSGKPTSNELDLSTIVTTKGSQLIALPSAAPTSGFDCAYALSTCTVQSPDCMTSWKAVANWGITSSYCP
jgi:hypothetical protein